MSKIIIVVEDGVIQDVYTDSPEDFEYEVLDYDVGECSVSEERLIKEIALMKCLTSILDD